MKTKLAKKWRDLGWKETSDCFYGETYSRTVNGNTQFVSKTPSQTMWRATQFNEDVPTISTLHPTMAKALSFFKTS